MAQVVSLRQAEDDVTETTARGVRWIGMEGEAHRVVFVGLVRIEFAYEEGFHPFSDRAAASRALVT